MKVAVAQEHSMHGEQIVVKRETLKQLQEPHRLTVAVGTTSMRTLESAYWYGAMLTQNPTALFHIPSLFPYQCAACPPLHECLHAIANKMDALGVDELTGTTEIFIFPGYTFRVVQGLVTNFHQPGSTLILLVAAFTGHSWKKIYEEALSHQYRFLSYGDSSLLIPQNWAT